MNDAISDLKQLFEKKDDIILAFLFGSQVTKKTHENSDYDIAVWFKTMPSIDAINELWTEIISLLHNEVDLVVLNQARPTVAWAALRGQKLLIRDYDLFLKLFLEISREAEDMQDFAIELWNLKKRMKMNDPTKS